MKVFGFYKSKKYLQRVMFSIMATMVMVIVATSVSNTYVLEKSVKSVQEDSNLKVLSQIQYNLTYMNDIISRLAQFVYRDQFLIPLMFSSDIPEMDFIRGHQQMNNIMESSSFLQSMVIYNKVKSELYGTNAQFLLDGGITKERIRNSILNNGQQPTNRLIPMSLTQDEGRVDTFAFIVTDSLKPFTNQQSAIILFIKSDWVFESLKKMNVGSGRDQGEVYIQTQDGQILSSDLSGLTASEENQNNVKQLIQADKLTNRHSAGFVIGKWSGEKNMITYMDDGYGSWTILYVQSYDKLMEIVTETRNHALLLSGISLVLAIAISIWLSYKLYNPIESMIKRINPYLSDNKLAASKPRDELGLMSENILELTNKWKEISSEKIVNKYYIRKFLTESQLFTHLDMQHLIKKHELNISIKDPLLVCVLKIDRFADYDSKAAGSSKKLYNFAFVNISSEIMSRRYPCEAVELRGDHIVLIVSRNAEDTHAEFSQVIPLLREIQETIEGYYNVSLSCGISDVISQYPFLSSAYTQALQLSQYMIVKGFKAIITSQDMQQNLQNKDTTLPDAIGKRLAEALKKGQMTNAGNELEKAFSFISALDYEDIIRSVSNLAWLIKDVVNDMNKNRIVSFDIEIDNLHQIAQDKDTLEEMYVALLAVCSKICEGGRPAVMERNQMMLETIKELIEQKYADINLSQQSIANTVKLSSAYIGKLFKESYQMTITEYMNDVRLKHAQEYLERDDYTIAEIMDKCGYANQSYFFRLFKAKVGSTPKEYRMKKSIS
ncbi:AraC family transcriptional regulator [Paenibacillus sp. HB172176]|uniref:helix-turn-helix domain-containing protein n=1 Tax=Paenibacillus sp. HB172176 TaxID=2493690 RepID=UPI0014387681|nr:AraC family transcriptional regulator [Paenibacillus sp. HB172176]